MSADRLARASLSRYAAPGDAALSRVCAVDGAVAAWDQLRARLPGSCWPLVAPERDLEAADRVGARLVCPQDPDWPPALADLAHGDGNDAAVPFALWVRGTASLSHRRVAVVGSRAATAYGEHVATALGHDLAEAGWTVVSGGAYGIDGAAHKGALAARGVTVAVLAGGVDRLYPRGHDALLRRVAETGLLISEGPPGTSPMRHRFLSRNRLIAALGRGVVVVEAGRRSGALNTAAHAGRLQRPLLAVPGPVTSAMSAGCHQLLRSHAAQIATDARDVLEVCGDLVVDVRTEPEPELALLPRDRLDAEQVRVLDAVPARVPAGPARIARTAGVDASRILIVLGELVAQDLVEGVAGGWRLGPAA